MSLTLHFGQWRQREALLLSLVPFSGLIMSDSSGYSRAYLGAGGKREAVLLSLLFPSGRTGGDEAVAQHFIFATCMSSVDSMRQKKRPPNCREGDLD